MGKLRWLEVLNFGFDSFWWIAQPYSAVYVDINDMHILLRKQKKIGLVNGKKGKGHHFYH